MARQTQEQVEAEIATLDGLSLQALRRRWRALYGNPAPRSLRRGLLIRAVAYQLQVKAFGGLAAVTKKKLREIAVATREGRFDPAVIGPRVKPGHPAHPGLAGRDPQRARARGRLRVERHPLPLALARRQDHHGHQTGTAGPSSA
jgi:hypothetical protein